MHAKLCNISKKVVPLKKLKITALHFCLGDCKKDVIVHVTKISC